MKIKVWLENRTDQERVIDITARMKEWVREWLTCEQEILLFRFILAKMGEDQVEDKTYAWGVGADVLEDEAQRIRKEMAENTEPDELEVDESEDDECPECCGKYDEVKKCCGSCGFPFKPWKSET